MDHQFTIFNVGLQNALIRLDKPTRMRQELEELAISYEKVSASTSLGGKKDLTFETTRALQVQHNSTSASGQKRKSEDCLIGKKSAKHTENPDKKSHMQCYNYKKSGHLVKNC